MAEQPQTEKPDGIPEFVNDFFAFVEQIEDLESVATTDEAKILGDRDNPEAGRVMIDLELPSIPRSLWDVLDQHDATIADANAFGSVLSVTARLSANDNTGDANDTDSASEDPQPDEPSDEPAAPESDPNPTQFEGEPKLQPVPKLDPFERIQTRPIYRSGHSPTMTLDKELLAASGLSLGDEVSQYATDGRVLLLRDDKDPYEESDEDAETSNETNSVNEDTQS